MHIHGYRILKYKIWIYKITLDYTIWIYKYLYFCFQN